MENSFDIKISSFFKELLEKCGGVSGKLASISTVISGLFIFFIFLGIIFLFKKEYRLLGISILICSLLTFISNDLIFKKIFQRERPYIYFYKDESIKSGIDLIKYCPGFYISSYSFPSGHSGLSSAGTFSIFFYYLFINKKRDKTLLGISITSFVITFFVVLSRLVLLHHYFTDCLVGIILGLLLALLVVFIIRIYLKKKQELN